MKIFPELPEGTIKVESIWDFVTINPKLPDKHQPKYGGLIYIKSKFGENYEEYPFDDNVTSEKIKKYISTNQLYFLEKK